MKEIVGNSEALKNAMAVVGFAFFSLIVYFYITDINIGGGQ